MFLPLLAAAAGNDRSLDEYQVKAAFLLNFARFVEWPTGTFHGPTDPITLCVFDKGPFDASVEGTIAGQPIHERVLEIRHVWNAKQVAGCRILFVGSEETGRAAALLREVGTAALLTVGDDKAPGGNGSVINFRNQGGKVRFEIDVEAARRQNLYVSVRMLSLASRILHAPNNSPR